jgi:hypothetical protein
MENLKHIEELLEKYYNGDTSLEEERKLHWYFQTHEIPMHLKPDAEIFRYHYKRTTEEASPGISEKLSKLIEEQRNKSRFILPVRSIRWISGIAASILIMLSLWIGIGRDSNRQRHSGRFADTFDDPQLAYLETKKTLLLVSEKLNAGTKELQYLKKYNQSVGMLEPILSFGPSIQRLDKISRFNEATELITKKQ